MDHLSYLVLGRQPSSQTGWPPTMPVYTLPGYEMDDALFSVFDEELSDEELCDKLLSDTQEDRYFGHSHLQAWSFFGLIKYVFGVHLPPVTVPRSAGSSPLDAYILKTQSAGLSRFDTTGLRNITAHWIRETRKRFERYTGPERLREHARVIGALSRVGDAWTTVYIHSRHRRRPHAVDPNLALAVALLCEYINWASCIAHQPPDTEANPVPRGPNIPAAIDRVTDYMRSAGWCPAELSLMTESFTLIDMWRLSFLEVPHVGKDHSGCAENQKCTAYQINERSYKTKHDDATCPGGNCEFVFASTATVSQILLGEGGGIPLIRNSDARRSKKDKRLYVELVSSRPTNKSNPLRWVAISHVWSDGLGNNKENGIPLCQFERLRRLAVSIPSPGSAARLPFWQDTLCFPLRPQDAYDMALIRMKESYEGAHAVLVLDRYLLGVDVKGGQVPMEEVMARIVVSPWNRRLWTWQEAFLARRHALYFQFRDEAVGDKALLGVCEGNWMTDADQAMDLLLNQRIYARFRDIRTKTNGLPLMERIAMAKDTLTFRSTSQAPDEVLCLANILGVDTAAILETKERDRMLVFWNKVVGPGQHHASMIFWEGPKLDVPGFRWAPATFMDASRVAAQEEWRRLDGCATGLSNDGLHVQLPSIACLRFDDSYPGSCYLKVQKEGWTFEAPLNFILTIDDWSKMKRRQQESDGFIILLPWMFETSQSWIGNVQIATRSKKGDNKLRLTGPGILARISDDYEQDQQPTTAWVDGFALAKTQWIVD